jgi:hypothetical protein
MPTRSHEIEVRAAIELLSGKLDKDDISIDGIILVQSVIEDLKLYNVLMELALKDGIITKEEQGKLKSFRKVIIEHSKRIISKDNIITDEEIELFKIINSLVYKEELIDFTDK